MRGFQRTYMTNECKTLKEQWQWEAKSQWKGAPLVGEVNITLTLFHGNKIKRDVDNFNKLVFDALTGIVYDDDNQVAELTIKRAYDKENPRVEVELSTHEG